MDRVVRGTGRDIFATFYGAGGEAVNPTPDSATVTIVRDDGTSVVADQPAVDEGTGRFRFRLTPAHTAQLDLLRVRWTATVEGSAQTIETLVEVCGGVFFSMAEARALGPKSLGDAAKYPAERILAARTMAEQALEDAGGVAFVPRYARERRDGSGSARVRLSRRRVRAVRSLKIAGAALSSAELAEVVPHASRFLYRPAGFPAGVSNVDVAYEHGHDAPPLRAGPGVLALAKRLLVEGPFDDRATSLTTNAGTFTYVTPGVRGAVFDIPELNALVEQYGHVDGIG